MGRTPILALPPPRSREQTYIGLARQFYLDGKFDLAEYEHAVDVILAGGSIHDLVELGLPSKPPPPLDPSNRTR